jgi:hypothetical protein
MNPANPPSLAYLGYPQTVRPTVVKARPTDQPSTGELAQSRIITGMRCRYVARVPFRYPPCHLCARGGRRKLWRLQQGWHLSRRRRAAMAGLVHRVVALLGGAPVPGRQPALLQGRVAPWPRLGCGASPACPEDHQPALLMGRC